METGARRRFQLLLTPELWNVLVAEAERCALPMSVVIRERLAQSFGLDAEQVQGVEPPVRSKSNQRRQYRLWVGVGLWSRLTEEAAAQGMSVTAVIRERLRQGVTSTRHAPVPGKGLSEAPDMPGPIGTKAISVFDLSE